MSGHTTTSTPNVLVIPDGNRRWAREHGVDYDDTYELTAKRMLDIAHHLGGLGGRDVWFSATRPFNKHRDPDELDAIFHACTRIHELGRERGMPVNIRADGDLTLVSKVHTERLTEQEKAARPELITAHLLFDWGADAEVANMFRYGQMHPEAPTDFASLRQMSVVNQPIDLVIRTGLVRAEHSGRLSGIIPWHSTDAQLVFPPVLFPDFTLNDLDGALAVYHNVEHKNQTAVT